MVTAAAVVTACTNGMNMLEGIAATVADDEWARPTPCPCWTVQDLLGHAACIAEDYSGTVRGLIAGTERSVLRGPDIDIHNAIRLREIGQVPFSARLARFGTAARAFIWAVSGAWQRPAFDADDQRWTVGRYAAMCAIEWHVHAWDLGWSLGLAYRPTDVAELADVWTWAFPQLTLPVGDSWDALLRVSGRSPDRIR